MPSVCDHLAGELYALTIAGLGSFHLPHRSPVKKSVIAGIAHFVINAYRFPTVYPPDTSGLHWATPRSRAELEV